MESKSLRKLRWRFGRSFRRKKEVISVIALFITDGTFAQPEPNPIVKYVVLEIFVNKIFNPDFSI